MSEFSEFVSVGINIGPARLTISAANAGSLMQQLNGLLEADELDPEGLSPISTLVDGISTIHTASEVKFAMSRPQPVVNATPVASAPGDAPTCAHGSMKWKEGTSKAGNNYKGWFCQAPYGQPKCDAKFIR